MTSKQITEEMNVHAEWYEECKKQTLLTLPFFIFKLMFRYRHDYGTIVHAMTACALATLWAINKTKQGHITGFQAGCLQWEFIRNWTKQDNKTGLMLVDFDNYLYPQYCKPISVSQDVYKKIKDVALRNLVQHKDAHPEVIQHWKNIVNGEPIPFLSVEEED